MRIKAAGGISSFEDAKRFMELGADRLGTSRLVKLALAEEKSGAEMDGKPDTEVGEKPDGEPGAGGDADGLSLIHILSCGEPHSYPPRCC